MVMELRFARTACEWLSLLSTKPAVLEGCYRRVLGLRFETVRRFSGLFNI